MAENIQNYDTYTDGMMKSIRDKLFFEGLVQDVDYVIDYGCADGAILAQIHRDFPHWRLVGIDCDPTMLSMAKTKAPHATYHCAKNLDGEMFLKEGRNGVFHMSSVIHELYSYLSEAEVEKFWNELFYGMSPKYISIRDFMISNATERNSSAEDQDKLYAHPELLFGLNEFENIHGCITKQKNLLHYLMKYRYHENWSREVYENYFPIHLEELLSSVPTDKYRVAYFSHYTLPYTFNKVKKDFGIEIYDNTHVKILLERIK